MAARKNPHHNPDAIERVRGIIQSRRIVERLTKFIDGEVEMSASQVTASLGLLRKVVPDLASVEHTGEVTKYVIRAPEPVKTSEEWEQRHRPH